MFIDMVQAAKSVESVAPIKQGDSFLVRQASAALVAATL